MSLFLISSLQVNIYAPNGECIKRVSPTDNGGREFKRPSDMVTLPDGRFLVRDDLGIQVCIAFDMSSLHFVIPF